MGPLPRTQDTMVHSSPSCPREAYKAPRLVHGSGTVSGRDAYRPGWFWVNLLFVSWTVARTRDEHVGWSTSGRRCICIVLASNVAE